MNAVIDFIANLFAVPFGYILSFLYGLTESYVLSLILITVFVKICLLPIEIYNMKKNKEKAETTAKIKAIKEKYPEDKEKAQQEIKLLQNSRKEKVKGLGFFTFCLQLFVLVGLLNVLNTPLTSILRFEESTIGKMEVIMTEAIKEANDNSRVQITILEEVTNHKETLLDLDILTEEELTEVLTLQNKFNLFNVNLSLSPEFKEINELWLFPLAFVVVMLISGVQALLEAWKKRGKLKGPLAFLDYVPLMLSGLYFFLFFMFPVGIIFYFTISNLLSFIQRIILSKIFFPAEKPTMQTVSPQTV